MASTETIQAALRSAGYSALYSAERMGKRFTASALNKAGVWTESERCATVAEAWADLGRKLLPQVKGPAAEQLKLALGEGR